MTAHRHGRSVALLGLGERRAGRLVGNDEVSAGLQTDDTWIRQRTGIVSRRLASGDESVVAMAVDAASKAVADAGIDVSRIGLAVLASCSLPQPVPGGAAEVASGIGAGGAGALDLNAACAGFCYALSVAADAVRAGSADYAVVAASERLSDITDRTDRATAILFGDGAAAAVVGPSSTSGIGPVVWGSDGSRRNLIDMTDSGALRMAGQAVFRWATTELEDIARQACTVGGIAPEELDAVVLHQANLRIVHSVARQLGATRAVVADDVVEAGNTSSASVPLALARLRREGRVPSGARALILGFGAGLTWAGCVVTVP